jgi:hypothetical protein
MKDLSLVWKMNVRGALLVGLGALSLVACGGGPAPAESPSAEPESPQSATGADEPEGQDAVATDAPDDGKPKEKQGVKITGDGSEGPIALNDSDTAEFAHGAHPSKIKPTKTETAMRFFIVDKGKGGAPIPGIVVSMTSPEGDKYYTEETDAKGYAEVLVPVGKTYELEYLSLGRKTISAKVPVPDSPNQNIKLTLRYKRFDTEGKTMVVQGPPPPNVFVLEGVNFDSLSRLDRVVEYMTHKKGVRIEISGHTDNVGKAEANKDLSRRRAESCKQYLVDKGIDAGRIETVGYGSERPIDTNDTPEGRQRNRRIEAKEL